MKKIKITQLENERLSNQEQLRVRGGVFEFLCGCYHEYDTGNTDSAFISAIPPRLPVVARPPQPWDCPCIYQMGYDGDIATAYMYK